MARKAPEETLDHAYAVTPNSPGLCLWIARDGFVGFGLRLPTIGTVTVGRDADASLSIASPSLSRLHFAIELRGDAAHVRDLGSRNGTRLDEATMGDAPIPILVGGEIVAGDVRFSLLRASTLPSVGRPLASAAVFEAALASDAFSGDTRLLAIELAEPVNLGMGTLEVLAQLPSEALVGLVSDTTLLLATSDARSGSWLLGALRSKNVGVVRHRERGLDGAPSVGALLRELGKLAPEIEAPPGDVPPAFRYASLRRLHDDLRRIAPRAISVLVTGETGTGKEVVARELHRLSGRTGPLVAVNTAALPENLIESELFGHEKGAFSGALATKVGLIESADQGTLFLDEIGELSSSLQAKLLRVLEDRTVRRVGATSERKVDLRIVAATHQDLEALASEKRFRQDLLFRLNGATLWLPPLRERRDEVGPLARQLLTELAPDTPMTIDLEAETALASHTWPGNVRELKHVLERAIAFADDGVIGLAQLPVGFSRTQAASPAHDVRSTVRDFEKERILEALRTTGGNRTRAAELLGLPRRTLVYKLSKMRVTEE